MRNPDRFPMVIKEGSVVVRIYRSKSDRTKSGWLYQLCWHDGESRRTRQFARLQKAEDIARDLAYQLRMGRRETEIVSREDLDMLTSAKSIAGKVGIVTALKEWKRANRMTDGNILEAAKLWEQIYPEHGGGIGLKEAIQKFLKDKGRQGVNIKLAYKNRFDKIQAAFPDHTMASIKTRALTDYLNSIDHPVTRNTFRKNIVTLWRWARSQGFLPDTTTAAEKTPVAQETDRTQIEIFTPDEFGEVLGHFDVHHPKYTAAIVLAGFCGLRRGEVHTQAWEDIDLAAGSLQVTNAKPRTPADRIVEIPTVGIEWLVRCIDRVGPVCSNLAIDRIKDICRDHDLATPKNGFRHSAITYKMSLGMSAGQVASWAGTSEKQIHRHYRRPQPKIYGEGMLALTPGAVLRSRLKSKKA